MDIAEKKVVAASSVADLDMQVIFSYRSNQSQVRELNQIQILCWQTLW